MARTLLSLFQSSLDRQVSYTYITVWQNVQGESFAHFMVFKLFKALPPLNLYQKFSSEQ